MLMADLLDGQSKVPGKPTSIVACGLEIAMKPTVVTGQDKPSIILE
jgi:hypothetical protein